MHRSIRVTLLYSSDGIRVRSVRTLAMRAPPGDAPERKSKRPPAGQFVELRGQGGDVLWRRRLADGVPRTLEAPTGQRGRSFTRHPVGRRKGIVSVLVPDLEGAREVAVAEYGAEPEKGQKATKQAKAKPERRDLVTVDLEEYRKREREQSSGEREQSSGKGDPGKEDV